MQNFLYSFVLVLSGAIFGASIIGFAFTTGGQNFLKLIMVGLAGTGIGVGLVFLIFHIIQNSNINKWNFERYSNLIKDSIVEYKKNQLTDLNIELKKDISEIAKIIFSFFMATRALALTGILLGMVISIATLLTAFIQIEKLENQNRLIKYQNELSNQTRRATLAFQVSDLLANIGSASSLSTFSLSRLAFLSSALVPYEYGHERVLASPERAQILMTLISSGVDIQQVVKAGVSFEFADLRNANLGNHNLSGIDLNNAKLDLAYLDGADLSGAFLQKATLPEPQDFKTKKITNINLEGAVPNNTEWISLYIQNISEGNVSSNKNTKVVVQNKSEEGSFSDFNAIYVENDFLSEISAWQQKDNVLQRNFEYYQIVEHFISIIDQIENEPSVTGSEIVRGSWDEMTKMLKDSTFIDISENTRIAGGALKNNIFNTLINYHEKDLELNDLDFSYIDTNFTVKNLILDGKNFSGSNFSNSDLKRIQFTNSNLTDADFSKSILSSVSNFKGTKLEGAIFDGATVSADWMNDNYLKELEISGFDPGVYDFRENCDHQYDINTGWVVEGDCLLSMHRKTAQD